MVSLGEELVNYISDTVLDGAVGWLGDLYEDGVTSVISFAFDGFRPDVATFNSYVTEEYFQIFPLIGYIIAIFLFAAMLVFIAFGAIKWAEVKESPWEILGRFVISLFLIYNSEAFVNTFFKIADYIWDKSLSTSSLDISGLVCQMAIPTALVSTLGFSTTSVVGIFLVVLFGVVFLKQFIKFALEVIERYIVACFLYYVGPLAESTIVSKNASGVFKKYLQMLIVQLLMLIMNLIFIRAIAMMIGSSSTLTFTGFIFLLAFMKVAQRIDNYAFTMGLSVAVTGGSVLDAVAGSASRMLAMSRGLQSGAGMAGNVLAAKGAAVGDLSMLKKGMDIQKAARPSGAFAAKTTQGEALDRAVQMGSAKDIARGFTPRDIDSSMVDMARSGKNNAIFNEMPMEAKEALFEKAYGDDMIPENASLKSLAWNKQGDCMGELDVTQPGMNGEDGKHFTTAFKISDQASPDAISVSANENGTNFYMTSQGGMQEGESLTVNPADPASVSSAEMISGMNFSDLGDMSEEIQSVTKDADGSYVFRDGEGDILARMDKGRNGQSNIAFNDDFVLNNDSINKLPSMQHLDGICMENNLDGTVSLYGKNKDNNVEKYQLYNKAIYSKDAVETATGSRAYAGFGNRNRTTGSWYITKSREKQDALSNQYDFAVARSDDAKDIKIGKITNKQLGGL